VVLLFIARGCSETSMSTASIFNIVLRILVNLIELIVYK